MDRNDQGGIVVWADPSSQAGIAKVTTTLDGTVVSELTAPNQPPRGVQTVVHMVYGFGLSASAVAPCTGEHTVVVTATDSAGNTQSATFAVPHTDVPALTVDATVDANQTLHVTGSACTDSTDPLSVTAKLGNTPVLGAGAGPFSDTLDVSGLAAGDYTLTVRADVGQPGLLVKAWTIVTKTITITRP